jgi:hypothetical protein
VDILGKFDSFLDVWMPEIRDDRPLDDEPRGSWTSRPRNTDHGPRTTISNLEPRNTTTTTRRAPRTMTLIPSQTINAFWSSVFDERDFSLGLPNKYHTLLTALLPILPGTHLSGSSRYTFLPVFPSFWHPAFPISTSLSFLHCDHRDRTPLTRSHTRPYLDTSPIPPHPHLPLKTLPFNSNVLSLPCSPRPLLSTLRQESLLEQLECIAADVAVSEEGKRWAWRVDGWEVT